MEDKAVAPAVDAGAREAFDQGVALTPQTLRTLIIRHAKSYSEWDDGSLERVDFGQYGFASFTRAALSAKSDAAAGEPFDAEQHQVLIGYDANGDAVFGTETERAAKICDQVVGQSQNHLFRSGAKICAGLIRDGAYPKVRCDRPPEGWYCTRDKGHEGPCAAHPASEPKALTALHKELGQLRWMGADEGWDRAIKSVRARIAELLRESEG
jgi:hypothetical protein